VNTLPGQFIPRNRKPGGSTARNPLAGRPRAPDPKEETAPARSLQTGRPWLTLWRRHLLRAAPWCWLPVASFRRGVLLRALRPSTGPRAAAVLRPGPAGPAAAAAGPRSASAAAGPPTAVRPEPLTPSLSAARHRARQAAVTGPDR